MILIVYPQVALLYYKYLKDSKLYLHIGIKLQLLNITLQMYRCKKKLHETACNWIDESKQFYISVLLNGAHKNC